VIDRVRDVGDAPSAHIEKTSLVDVSATLGEGVRIWNWVRVREGAKLGRFVMLGDHVHVGPNVTIGDRVRIGNAAQLHSPAVIGPDVFIGPGAFLGNDRTPMNAKGYTEQGVTVGPHAIIGACAKIMGGVCIGAGAVVGMGAVVLHDVMPGEIVCGVPAKVKGQRPKHGRGTALEHWAPLGEDDECPVCGEAGGKET